MALTPMMGGVLVTSIASGQIISRIGRYHIFPIMGTAVMTVGLALLSRLGTDTPVWAASCFMLVLGLGLGMVMQVLVLAVQNAVDYRHLGVATSGATLFRSIGGSVGVAIFGAIFAAGLSRELSGHLPAGAALPTATDAASIAALPEAIKVIYLDAFVAALHPVFLSAAVVAMIGFALARLLREVPLRWPARAEDLASPTASRCRATPRRSRNWRPSWPASAANTAGKRSSASPRASISTSGRTRSGCSPGSGATMRRSGSTRWQANSRFRTRNWSASPNASSRGVSQAGARAASWPPPKKGRGTYRRMVTRYRARLTELVERWHPRNHAEVRTMLNEFAQGLIADLPLAPQPLDG